MVQLGHNTLAEHTLNQWPHMQTPYILNLRDCCKAKFMNKILLGENNLANMIYYMAKFLVVQNQPYDPFLFLAKKKSTPIFHWPD